MTFTEILSTSGTGLWSSESRKVSVNRIGLAYLNDTKSFGELRVYFDESTWDTTTDGLIYTDPFFLQQLKEALVRTGYSPKACEGIDYSEQGMQGDNFVSFDVNAEFIREWSAEVAA